MKNLIYLLFATLLFISCSKSEDDDAQSNCKTCETETILTTYSSQYASESETTSVMFQACGDDIMNYDGASYFDTTFNTTTGNPLKATVTHTNCH